MHAFGSSRQVVTLAYLNLSENKLHEGNNITTTYSNPKWHGLIFTKTGREEGVGGGFHSPSLVEGNKSEMIKKTEYSHT
jgi:hypothetical protein